MNSEKPRLNLSTILVATLVDVQNNEILKQDRKDQLKKRKNEYQWQQFPNSGLPSAIKDNVLSLPDDEQFDLVKNVDFTKSGLEGVLATTSAGAFMSIKDIESYVELLKNLDQSPLKIQKAGRWTSDVEFGRQILNGVNPVVIEKCTEIPKNFRVTNDLVAPFLTRGKTLDEEMKVQKRIDSGHV